jgi:3-dehydrosphinganine reductase
MADFYRDRLCLVVGGSEGIGRAVATGLSARGSRVIVAARREGPLRDAQRATGAAGSRAFDVADWAAVDGAVRDVVASDGVPDIVVNCAGLALPGWLHEVDVAELDEMMRVNYMGTVHVCRAIVPHMIARRSGVMVNTASMGGLLGLFGYTGYCGSKFAVVGFSEALRREVAPHGVRVTLLCPPNTRTPGLARENLRKPAEVLAQEEKVATLEPEAVAEALLRALPKGKSVVIPTLDGQAAWWLARVAPWLLERILRRG